MGTDRYDQLSRGIDWQVSGPFFSLLDDSFGKEAYFRSTRSKSSFGQANYGAMKLGTVGFSNALALEGAKANILVNAIAPNSATRMTASVMSEEMFKATGPERVAPLVGFLCSDLNKVSGGIFEVGGSWIARTRWQRSHGAFIPIEPEGNLTVEKVKAAWKDVLDYSDPSKVTFPTTVASQREQVSKNVPSLVVTPNKRANAGAKL